jgi:hypothetical protein
MTTVYLLWHWGSSEPSEGDDPMLLGVYSTRERAEARVKDAVTQPGFRDYPNGFEISPSEVDKDEWTQGFVTYEYPLEGDPST